MRAREVAYKLHGIKVRTTCNKNVTKEENIQRDEFATNNEHRAVCMCVSVTERSSMGWGVGGGGRGLCVLDKGRGKREGETRERQRGEWGERGGEERGRRRRVRERCSNNINHCRILYSSNGVRKEPLNANKGVHLP